MSEEPLPRLRMRLDVELLSDQQLERIFQHALTIWREVPFRVQGADEFFDLLTAFGLDVSGELVRCPQTVLDQVLDRVKSHKAQWVAAHPDPTPPWPSSDLGVFTHGQALHICDLETNALRPCTEADLTDWCHLVDALPGDVDRQHPTFIPQDVPLASQDFHAYATIILNSRRAHRVSVYSAKMLPFFIEASIIAQGSREAVAANPLFAAKCWVTSPFMLDRENVEIAMAAKRLLGQPITFGLMPVAGASTPLTVAGALAQNTAESLALCALRLATDDLTCGITPSSSIMDMRAVNQRQSGPDLALHAIAGAQMNAWVWGGWPSLASGYTGVGAKVVSPQSLSEKAFVASFSVAAGARSLGLGSLAFSDVGSPVQLLLDYELASYFQRLLRPVSVDDEHVGLQSILETAPRGAYYLETEETSRFFREECWLPEFLDFQAPLAFVANPTDMIDRARSKARQMQAAAQNQCPLSAAEQQAIRELVREADRAAAHG